MTLGESFSYALWQAGELAFKWVPGVTVSLITSQGGADASTPQVPAIGNAVSTGDVVDFLKVNSDPVLYQQIFDIWRIVVGVSVFLSLLFGAFLIYCFVRIVQHRRAHFRHIEHIQHSLLHHNVPKTVLRWDHIKEQVSTENEQSWRLAILEADIMLGELLDSLGYRGETMADKMKQVERGDFRTIDLAWEAHKVRNKIAHEGTSLILSSREAQRIIGLYEQAFREHGFTG